MEAGFNPIDHKVISVAQPKREVQPTKRWHLLLLLYGWLFRNSNSKYMGRNFSPAIINVSSFNSTALMAILQPSSTLVDRQSIHSPPRAICNLIFPTSSSHCAWQMVIRAFINVSPPSFCSLIPTELYQIPLQLTHLEFKFETETKAGSFIGVQRCEGLLLAFRLPRSVP